MHAAWIVQLRAFGPYSGRRAQPKGVRTHLREGARREARAAGHERSGVRVTGRASRDGTHRRAPDSSMVASARAEVAVPKNAVGSKQAGAQGIDRN